MPSLIMVSAAIEKITERSVGGDWADSLNMKPGNLLDSVLTSSVERIPKTLVRAGILGGESAANK